MQFKDSDSASAEDATEREEIIQERGTREVSTFIVPKRGEEEVQFVRGMYGGRYLFFTRLLIQSE